MPRATSEGVTGVIDGKLWVLPGTCSGENWPDPKYCDHEPFRRLFRYDPVLNKWGTRHQREILRRGRLRRRQERGQCPRCLRPGHRHLAYPGPAGRRGIAIGAVIGNKLFVIVGRSAYAYDPATNTWKVRAGPAWEHDALVRVAIDGQPRLLAVGGVHDGPDGHLAGDVSEFYTP